MTKISRIEEMVLGLLLTRKLEMYGLELVEASAGQLARGTVYVTLSRMVDKGLLKSRDEEKPANRPGLPRKLYTPTGHGQRAFQTAHELRSTLFAPFPAGGAAL